MGGFFDSLIGWSIHNRVVVLLGAAAAVIGSVWIASHASLEVLPDFTPPFVVVQAEASAMPALDVEQLVTRPLEQVLLGTPQTTAVRSTSSPGLSVITVFFEDNVDVYRARQLVTERLQVAQARLPQSVSPPQLMPIVAPIGALVRLALTSSAVGQDRAMRDLRTFADWTLRPRLLAIPGVAQVMPLGGFIERLEVRPDPVRMQQRGVSMSDLSQSVRTSQSLSGAGFAETPSSRLDVQNDMRLRVADATAVVANTIIARPMMASVRGQLPPPVRIGDVADVLFADEPPVGAALYDGRPAVFLQVNKLPDADTVAVTEQVEAALRQAADTLPPGGRIEPPVFRQATFVTTSLRSVGRAMLIGTILVIFIIISFLRYGRLAVISLTAIPLSILTAAAVLVAFGASINGMTLGGLAIAVGEVVDDAIVDVENVWRRLRENAAAGGLQPPLVVVRNASREIRGSVVYATVIVAIVLIPVLSLGGIAGRIFSPLAHAYILAIGASLLVALTVTPAMCAWLLPPLANREPRLSRLSVWTLDRYRRVLHAVVERPRAVFAVTGVLAVAAAVALPLIGGRFLPDFHESSLVGHVTAVPGTSLTESVRLATAVDAQLRSSGLASHTTTTIGRAELSEDALPVYSQEFNIALKDTEGDWDDITLNVAKAIGRVPGLAFTVEAFLGERINEVLSGETAPVVVKVMGPDLQRLRAVAHDVAIAAGQTPGLGAIRPDPQIDVPQIRIRADAAQLARYGLTAGDVADDVASWRQGENVTQILGEDGRVINVAIAGPPAAREQAALGDIPIEAAGNATITLATLANVEEVPAPALINHENGERRIAIGIDVPGGGLSGAVSDLERRLAALRLPQGYRVEVTGEALARREAARQLAVTGALVLLGIFMLLATAFTSLRDATVTMLNFPLGLIGGVAGALITPDGLSVAGLVGFVTLFGIIARNGIMLIAHKQHLDAEHPDDDPVRRVARASEERLLPILMTAGAAGLGLLPLALSFDTAGSELEAPMALIVVLGLVTSTALNMLVIPTIYVWLERRDRRGVTA